ncbi:MAG: helix-turn-helix transcriptional regulator [Bacteroidales bacterium]|mgnify:CR=1 FL=1|nr:helix-turn-helix transcriptional regulator [Bacteroidales bacterium]
MTNREINRIKVVLAEKKIKNKWLAEKLKKNPSSVSQWCTNERQPSLETLLEMSILLEIDIRELLIPTK